MEIRSIAMKSKSLIKPLTLVFFFSLLVFFVLFQSGFIVRRSVKIDYSELYTKNMHVTGDSLKQKQFGLSTFQELKLRGAFDPENFDAMFIPYPVSNEAHLSSSKSIIINWERDFPSNDRYLKSMLKNRFPRKKENK